MTGDGLCHEFGDSTLAVSDPRKGATVRFVQPRQVKAWVVERAFATSVPRMMMGLWLGILGRVQFLIGLPDGGSAR